MVTKGVLRFVVKVRLGVERVSCTVDGNYAFTITVFPSLALSANMERREGPFWCNFTSKFLNFHPT